MADNVFYYYDESVCAERTLHVLRGSLAAYQADGRWNQYFGNIVEFEPVTTQDGDINGDGDVNIADVTDLIDILLRGYTPSAGADINGDGDVNIADVTDLIDYLLSGTWSN